MIEAKILYKALMTAVVIAAPVLMLFSSCGNPIGPPVDEQFNSDIIYGSFKDSRDGQKYRTVFIGGKMWMAENLNYKTSNSWCYNNKNYNCNTYGRLYTWNAARSACPSGWRLPNDSDWDNLISAVGSNAGTKLKSQTGWNGTDEFGFSALPGGYRNTAGSFSNVGNWGYWWSATEVDASYARGRTMVFINCYVYSYWGLQEQRVIC